MFCFNEAPNQTEIPPVLWILEMVAARMGCSSSLPGCLCDFVLFVFSVPPHLHRGWENHKPTWGCASLCGGSDSPQIVFSLRTPSLPCLSPSPPQPPSAPSADAIFAASGVSSGRGWQNHCSLQKAWALLLSEVSTAWFMRPYFAWAPVRQRIYLQKENNKQPRVLFSVPHR